MHTNTRQAVNASTRSVYAKWYWVNHGRLTSERQAHQRTQSLLPSATHRHSSITRPCCSSAQAPRCACNQHEWPGAWTLQRREKKTRERKAYLPLPIVTHQSLDPANINRGRLTSEQSCTRTLEHSNTKWYWVNHGRTIMHSNTRQAKSRQARALKRQASCLLRVGRRAVEVIICMITRDFSVISIDVTGVSLSLSQASLSLSTTHKSHSRTI